MQVLTNQLSSCKRGFTSRFCQNYGPSSQKVALLTRSSDDGPVTGAAWLRSGDLVTCGDDGKFIKWKNGEVGQDMFSLADLHPTAMALAPTPPGKTSGVETFAVGSSDGGLRLLNASGRVDKKTDAHKGAILSLKWSADGAALATGGEDGFIKIWSKSGILRSTLPHTGKSVYSLEWSAAGDQIAYTHAHDGLVLSLSWSAVTGYIASGSEDGKFKVFDAFGRTIHSSPASPYPTNHVSWRADGSELAVGEFSAVRVVLTQGWTSTRATFDAPGSIVSTSWSPDGTLIATGSASGEISQCRLVGKEKSGASLLIRQTDASSLYLHDAINGSTEDLKVRDPITMFELGHDHLVVATTTQIYCYSSGAWDMPAIVDTKVPPSLITMSSKHFVTADGVQGLRVFDFEGHPVAALKIPGIRGDLLRPSNLSISEDSVVVVDSAAPKTAKVFQPTTGRAIGQIVHKEKISAVSVFAAPGSQPVVAFVDVSGELFISNVTKPAPVNLANMVTSMSWHATAPILSVLTDCRLVVWTYPQACLVDPDLKNLISTSYDGPFDVHTTVISHGYSQVVSRLASGGLHFTSVSPHPPTLYRLFQNADWEEALRLCRVVNDKSLWAALAGMAIEAKELGTAEVAYASIEMVATVHYLAELKEIPTIEARNAELALFRREPAEAEAILVGGLAVVSFYLYGFVQLQAGLTFRAIEMHLRLYNWERALELAVRHRTHVDTVLSRRGKHLALLGRAETNARFQQYAEEIGPIDEVQIESKITAEKEAERQRSAM